MNRSLARAFAVLLCVGCGDEIELSPCDVRKESCQQAVFLAVQRVRGTAWDPWLDLPPLRVISKRQRRDELEAEERARANQPMGFDYETPAFKLLHMIDPDEAPDSDTKYKTTYYVALYDGALDLVTIIDPFECAVALPGEPQEACEKPKPEQAELRLIENTKTLAHEFVHAAQNRDIGYGQIGSWMDDIDSANATRAVMEGEASHYENLVGLLMRGVSPTGPNWPSDFEQRIADSRTGIARNPSPWRPARDLSYPLGERYLYEAWRSGGPPGVRRVFQHHPTSTQRLMGELHGPLDVPEAPWTCAAPAAPSGYAPVENTTLGAWGLYAFATQLTEESSAWSFGEQWSGDKFTIYADADKAVALIWQLRVRDARAAALAELVSSATKLAVSVQLEGDRVIIAAAQKPGVWDNTDWSACK